MRITLLLLGLLLASAASAVSSVRVLTYNVYAKPDPIESLFTEQRMNKLCERLREGPWDIVMLQEVWTKNHRQRLRGCGYPHVMDLRATGSAKRERNLGSGLLILSRLPLEEQQRKIVVRPAGLKAIVLHGEGLARKSVYIAKARLADGRFLWLANTHLVANYCTTSDFAVCTSYQNVRLSQLKQVREFLWQKTAGEALVFGGDLNFGAHPASHDRSWDEFATLFPGFQQAPHGPEISTSSETNSFKDDENGKIDHIYVSPDLQPRDGALVFTDLMTTRKGVETHISDHYGWETTVDIH